MARISTVDPESVAQACAQMFAEGKNVSFDAVYDLIGRKGSARVVQNLIAEWRKEMAERFTTQRASPSLPADLVEASDTLAATIWHQALAKADEAYSAQRADLETQRAAMSDAIQTAQNRAAEFEKLLIASEASHDGTKALLKNAEMQIGQLQIDLVNMAASLRANEEQIVGLREDIARLNTLVENERQSHEAALTRERVRHEEALAVVQASAQASLDREREVAAGERQHLMMQTDQIRQAARTAEVALKEQVVEAKTMAEAYRRKAGDAESQVAYQRGRAEAAERQMREMDKRLQEQQDVLAVLKAEFATKSEDAAVRSGFAACPATPDPKKNN